MKLFKYTDVRGNFGDDLNFWLWDRLLPGIWDDDSRLMFSGIGTILSDKMSPASKWVVLGSGTGLRAPPIGFGESNWDILCVRGPLTAKVLGLSPDKALTDGAICLSLLPEYSPLPQEARKGIIFMPHHAAVRRGQWKEICELAGIEYLDPTGDDRETLIKLRQARLVIADAMHAAIVADTLRVPWIPVVSTPQINTFKWLDWALSMQVPYRPIKLPSSSLQEAFRGWFVRFWGEAYALDNPTPEAALEHYVAMRKLKAKKWWPWYRAIVRRINGVILHLLDVVVRIRSFWIKNVLHKNPHPDAYAIKSAAALRKIAESESFLSTQDVFAQRQKQMSDYLEVVAQKAKAI